MALLKSALAKGYTVVLCFIGLDGPAVSEERVAMRVPQGGHDVPSEKLVARYPRTLRNLARAIRELPNVIVHDNSDLARPFRRVAVFEQGRAVPGDEDRPKWMEKALLRSKRP